MLLGEVVWLLKNMGVKIVVVMVGWKVDFKNFFLVVNSINDLFGVKLFDDFFYEV